MTRWYMATIAISRRRRSTPIAATAARNRQRLARAGGGDHLRRRRFAGGERGRERIAAGQRRRDGERRRGPFVDLRPQALQDRRARSSDRGVLTMRGRRQDAGLLALVDQLREVLAVERALAGEELVEHEAERVDVAARRDLAARPAARAPCRRACPARIASPDAPASPKSVMRTLPVPSSITLAGLRSRWMTSRSCAAASPAQICRAISSARSSGKRPMRRSSDDEILAVDVLHREERAAVDLVDVVDAADVGVRDLPRHPHFGVELRQARGIAIDVRRAGTSARPAGRA